jgi:hypothetical protein
MARMRSTLTDPRFRRWALVVGQIAEARLRAGEKETRYPRYRAKRLPAHASSNLTDYALAACRSVEKDMDRMGPTAFAKLDRVLRTLAAHPTPADCVRFKLLPPNLRVMSAAECVIVYAIDRPARRLQILKITYCGKDRVQPPVKPAKRPPAPKKPRPSPAHQIEVADITQDLRQKSDRRGRLSKAERVVLAVGTLDSTMVVDDFDNFFRYSPHLAPVIVDSLLLIGCKRLARAAQRAVDALRLPRVTATQVEATMNRPDPTRDTRLSKCSLSYWKSSGPSRRLFAFIKANQRDIH